MPSILIRASVRREIRHAVDLPCWVVCEKDFRLASERILDLSPDGMRVELADVEVEKGDRFFACFWSTGKWFFSDAFAARLLLGRRPGERGRSLALRFGSLSGAARRSVRQDLCRVPPHLPQRAQRIDYAATVARILA